MKQTSRDRGGFTIVELLVAVAVFTILMSAIGALFAASIFTVRSGYTNIKANEEVRGLSGLLERDLHTAFISRDYGDTYQFYGTPIGMTFVGLARGYSIYENYVSGGAALNLGRVTYVVQQLPPQEAIAVRRYTDEAGDPLDEGFRTDEGVPTYAVIRYYEPGVRDLDTFPVNWEGGFYYEQTPTGEVTPVNIQAELENVRLLATLGYPVSVVEAMIRAKKRQLWIRLLSTPPYLAGGLHTLWDEIGQNPLDHVIAQNVVLPLGASLPVLHRDDEAYQGPVFFAYGLSRPNHNLIRAFWNADKNLPGIDALEASTLLNHYGVSLANWNSRSVPAERSYRHIFEPVSPFLRYPREYGLLPIDYTISRDENLEIFKDIYEDFENPDTPNRIIPIVSRAYNDVQDMLRTLDDRLWLYDAEEDEFKYFSEQWEPLISEIGTPVHPRLPELVVLKAGLLYESASPGMPDVQRPVDVVMNIPSGYMRSRPG